MIRRQMINELKYIFTYSMILVLSLIGVTCLIGGFQSVISNMETNLIIAGQSFPSYLLNFFGMDQLQLVPTYMELFFLFLMFLNLLVFLLSISHMVNLFDGPEVENHYLFLCRQLQSPAQIMFTKFITGFITNCISWTLTFIFCYFSLSAMNLFYSLDTSVYIRTIYNMCLWGYPVIFLATCIGLAYGTNQRREMTGGYFAFCVTFIIFLIGNSYKIVNLLSVIISKKHSVNTSLDLLSDILFRLKLLSPMSSLNPYDILSGHPETRTISLYLGVSLLLILLSVIQHKKQVH